MKTPLGWFFVTVGLSLNARADPLDVWHFRNPQPSGNPRSTVEFVNGVFLSTGASGELLTSPDGSNWTRRLVAGAYSVTGVSYGNGLYVVIGSDATRPRIFTSSDLDHWGTQAVPNTNLLTGIAFGGPGFVAVGNGGLIVSSTDATNWMVRTSGSTVAFGSVAFGSGMFVATDTGSSSFASVSSDAVTWSRVNVTVQNLGKVNYLNGQFYVAGGFISGGYHSGALAKSNDGTNWVQISSSPPLPMIIRDVAFGNGRYIATSSFYTFYSIFLSVDGTNFMTVPNAPTTDEVTYGHGVFVGVAADSTIYVSSEGTNWSSVLKGPVSLLTDIAYGNGTYAAVGGGSAFVNGGGTADPAAIVTADSGLSFSTAALPVTKPLSRIHFANGLFHVVGFNGTILRSTNGQQWVSRNSGVTAHLRSLTYGNGLWVAVGDGGVVSTSPDGQAWTLRFSGTMYDLNAVTFGENLFVAAGVLGTVLTSQDGLMWTVQFTDRSERLVDAAHGARQFVVVGEAGTVLTSQDGLIWDYRRSGTTQNLHAVTFGEGYFVAAGDIPYVSGNTVITSTNGTDWVRRNSSTSRPLYGARYINGSYFLLGQNGTILQSDLLSQIQLTGNWNVDEDCFELTITSRVGDVLQVQTCDALGSWSTQQTITNLIGDVRYTDTTSHGTSQRFYRALRQR